MVLTFSIDSNKIRSNVDKSLENYNFLDNQKYNLNIDNYTDMIILNIASFRYTNPFKQAFNDEYGINYAHLYGEKEIYWNQYENLKSTLNQDNDSTILYGRFWHGYQIVIRPLLYFFTYQTSLIIMGFIGLILIFLSCYLVLKKLSFKFLLCYIISLITLNIYIYFTCYQYFFTMILMILLVIIILISYKDKFNYLMYFYTCGALTTYFLYISFPLITFGFPMIIFLNLKNKYDGNQTYKDDIIMTLKCALSWLFGYVLFFSLKWIISTIMTGNDFINDSLMSVNQRLGISFPFNYFDTLKLNLDYFFQSKFNIILICVIFLSLIILFRGNTYKKIKYFYSYFLVALSPFLWILICSNHSAIHYWMVSYLFSISVFSLLSIIVIISEKKYNMEKIDSFNIKEFFIIIQPLLFVILWNFKIIYIIIGIFLLLIFKSDKIFKIFILPLIIICLIFNISELIGKNKFSKKEFFQLTYNELYNKVKNYGYEYMKNHIIHEKEKIDIKKLISEVNSDSVFLFECEGYIMVENNEIFPFLNCNDIMVTEGYYDH